MWEHSYALCVLSGFGEEAGSDMIMFALMGSSAGGRWPEWAPGAKSKVDTGMVPTHQSELEIAPNLTLP